MYTNSIKKFFALTFIYICLIIGIFVLQFKNDSTISEKIGNLHISLLESISDTGETSLKNKMSVVFNGLTFSANDDNPVVLSKNNKSTNLTLLSWEKPSPLSCRFNFTENVSLVFTLSDDSSTAHLSVKTNVPGNNATVYVPYGFASGSSFIFQTDTKVQIGSKKTAWELAANDISENTIAFTSRNNVASYSYYDFTKSFSFDMIASLPNASETAYLNSTVQMKNSLTTAFNNANLEANLSEQEVVSYIAAMAETGKYSDAIDKIPSSFKKSALRTYLSAPYLNTLEKMNQNLQAELQRFNDLITYAANNNTYDVYTTNYIADFMCMHPGSKTIQKLLTNTAAANVSSLSLSQLSGILYVYSELTNKNKTLAELLKPVTDACAKKIESMCSLDDNVITLSENGTFLSVIQASKVGYALIAYGKIAKNVPAEAAGRLIINSYLKNSSSFDLNTLAELYPIIVHDNRYYPHFEILTFNEGKAVWAFTCANNVGYENNNSGTITITIDFPVSNTHYLIVNGIPSFESIYIYDMKFRTDGRFETYNSSGYVYKKDSQVLLLKSRHKTELETIRFESKKDEPIITDTSAPAEDVTSASEPSSAESVAESVVNSANSSATE